MVLKRGGSKNTGGTGDEHEQRIFQDRIDRALYARNDTFKQGP